VGKAGGNLERKSESLILKVACGARTFPRDGEGAKGKKGGVQDL